MLVRLKMLAFGNEAPRAAGCNALPLQPASMLAATNAPKAQRADTKILMESAPYSAASERLMPSRQSCRAIALAVTHIPTTGAHSWAVADKDGVKGEAKFGGTMEDEGRAPSSSDFGMLLRHHRLAAGLSQEALAERARMSINGIGSLERGERRSPRRETLVLLAGALALDERQREEFEAAASRSGLPRRLGGAPVTVGPWAGASISNLPLQLKSFVGRDVELSEISARVRDHRLVTVAGAGGLGKTETALQIGRAMNASTDIAICFVGLAPVREPSLVVRTIASALGVQEVPNRGPLATLIAYLKNKTILLILDNCEHVIAEAASVVYALLSSCEQLRVLATSREPLYAAGEYVYRLTSLDGSSAAALFGDRAYAVDRHFALTEDNGAIVAEICRRLEGIPLAIELAAARVNALPLKMIAEGLDDRFSVLAGGERTALPRQQTMHATIAWSYDLLSPKEQRVFERLSVFAGGCTLVTASSVCADKGIAEKEMLDVLSALLGKSLLVADLTWREPRYVLLESFRQFGHKKLIERGEQGSVARRHALALVETARCFDQTFLHDAEEIYGELADAEMDNWRVALQWALSEGGDALCGLRLVGRLYGFWTQLNRPDGRKWLSLALSSIDDRTPADVEAPIRVLACAMDMIDGRLEEVCASYEGAVVLCRFTGDSVGTVRAQNAAVAALLARGKTDEAKAVLKEALALARELKLRAFADGRFMNWMGNISIQEGDLAAAGRFFEQAVRTYEAMGRPSGAATVRSANLSVVELLLGNPDLALAHAWASVSQLRALRESPHAGFRADALAEALCNAAKYFTALDRYDEAKAYALESLGLYREACDPKFVSALQSVAAAAALNPSHEGATAGEMRAKAAQVLGFADNRSMGRDALDQWEHDRIVSTLRDALGADCFAAYIARGAGMSEDEAVLTASELARS